MTQPYLKTVMTFTGPRNRAGRYPVQFMYPGEPNAFGGYYPHRTRGARLTEAKALDLARTYSRIGTVNNLPTELEQQL